MAEAEAVLAGEQWPVGPDQLLAHERRQPRRHLRLGAARAPATAPRWKSSPSTAPRSSTLRSAASSWSSRAASSAFSVGGTTTSSPALGGHRDHLGRRTAGCRPRRGRSARAAPPGRPAGSSVVHVARGERLEPQRRPATAGGARASSGRAMQRTRIGGAGREQRDLLDQVEERLLAPLDVVEHDHQRRRAARAACGTPRRSPPPRSPRRALPQQRPRSPPPQPGRRGQRAQLLDHLDHRPVGDPLAVGEAAAAHHPRLEPRDELRHQPRLAHARLPDDRHQLAALALERTRPRLPQQRQLRPLGPRTAASCERSGHLTHREQPERRAPASAFPFSSSGASSSTSIASRASTSVAAPIRISPGAAACCSRAATLTASPVTSVSSLTGHDLARVHPDPRLHPELRQRLPHLHRRPHRPHRVVLVHHRHPEHRHHRVPDELLHRPAVRLDDPPHPLEIPHQQRPHRLRITRLTQRRRPDHVAEHHRHRLALLAHLGCSRERRGAAVTEPGALRVLGAANGTCRPQEQASAVRQGITLAPAT